MRQKYICFLICALFIIPTWATVTTQASAPVINTETSSGVSETGATIHGYVNDAGGAINVTTWFEWGATETYGNNTTKKTYQEYDYFDGVISGLNPGTLYHYAAYGNNSDGTHQGIDRTFFTPPYAPMTISIENNTTDPTKIWNINWTKGQGAERSIIVYKNESMPTSRSDGIEVYNDTGNQTTIGNETVQLGEQHYFAIWSYSNETEGEEEYDVYSATYTTVAHYYPVAVLPPTIEIENASNVSTTTATFRAAIYDGNESCKTFFEYGNYTHIWNTTPQYRSTGPFEESISGLEKGMPYVFRAWVNNSVDGTYSALKYFITRPEAPENFTMVSYDEDNINMTWDKGEGANTSVIVRKTGSPPTSISDGLIVYNGTGTTFSDTNFSSHTSQYYRIWSKCEGYGLTQYSEDYESAATQNAEFDIIFPTYLEIGQYIMAWGMIRKPNGDPIGNTIINTTVQGLDGSIIAGPVKWNASNGNYQVAIATTSLSPGEYEIVVTYKNESNVTYTYRNKLYLAIDPTDPGVYVDAWVYYTFYDISTGTGLDDNYYKVYISHDTNFSSGDRVKGGKIGVIRSTGESITTNRQYYAQIRDFNDNIIPFGEFDEELVTVYDDGSTDNAYAGFSVRATEYYIDFGVYLNQLRIKNMNESTVYIVLRRTDGNPGQVLGRFIPPWEETEVFIPDGNYNLTVHYYNNEHPEYGAIKTSYPWDRFGSGDSETIDTDLFYWIQGYNLDDVINVIEEEGTWLYYTIFDMNTGSKLEDDFYKVYISEDTTFTSDDRIIGGQYKTSLDDVLHFKVVDYWNNRVYPVSEPYENITIVHTKTFLDIGIPLNQFLIKNTNSSLVYFRLTNGNFSDPVNNTWYNRWIPPHESQEVFVRSGMYNISIEYYYPHNGQFIRFDNISNYTIDQDIFHVIRGKNALLYFNFYNTNTGLGFPFESLKIYANEVRIPHNHIRTTMGENVTLQIKDFYDFILFNETYEIADPLTYKDLGLTFHSYKFTNDREDFFIVGLKKEGATRWWEKPVGPYETIEFLPPTGNYSIRVYNATLSYADFNETVNSTKAFVITGRNFSARVDEIIEGQQRVVTSLENQTESFNYTNSLLFETLDLYYYSNETIKSILNIFRQPHVWQVPTVNYTFEDVKSPITTLYAMIAIDGQIKVRWHATDDISGVSNVTLYYRLQNATQWKIWKTNMSASGEVLFNESIEPLVEGNVYWFKASAVDKKGNVEGEKDTNVYNLTYSTLDIEQPVDAGQLIKDAMSNWIFIVIVAGIIILVVIVILIERKQDKIMDKEETSPYRRNTQRRQPQQRESESYTYYEQPSVNGPYGSNPYGSEYE